MDRVSVVRPGGPVRGTAYPAALGRILGEVQLAEARAAVAGWAGYAPTPLIDRPRLAASLGIGRLRIKHEGMRFAVGSFKALGPPYALQREIARRGGDARRVTAIAATSGNHGRALAWGAARLGAACRIFMPAHTSAGREAAIAAFGAETLRIPGNFDDALAAAHADAARGPDRILVADAVVAGRDAIARDILAGYAVLAAEIAEACADGPPPSHVFVAAGNGTLAAATAAGLWIAQPARRPAIVTAEPETSDCVRRSLAAGAPVALADAGESVMDGLVVGTPSAVAWPILAAGSDAAVAVDDPAAVETLRRMAKGTDGDAALEIGETGIAAIAALVRSAATPAARSALGLCPGSDVVAIACEGVTDPDVFAQLCA